MTMTKILFVCHGNICRSPMAEYVMKALVKEAGLSDRFYIASAATSTEELGNPVHRGTKAKLRQEGIPCPERRAVRMRPEDVESFDWILGMDSRNIANIRRIAGLKDGDPRCAKIRRLLDFSPRPRDIADPWYTGDFDETFRDVMEGCRALLVHLEKELLQTSGA